MIPVVSFLLQAVFFRCGLLIVVSLATIPVVARGQSVRGAERVEFDSLDGNKEKPVSLFGWFFAAKAKARGPAVIALHGCGGLYGRDKDLNPRHRAMAELLQQEGYHVLFPDSFRPRGLESICAIKIGTRDITSANRRRDVFGALDWITKRPEVDASRIALLGWSHGGTTVLSANNRNFSGVAAHKVKPRAAIAFYPGCTAYLKARDDYRPNAPLLLMIGEKDDWTPAKSCVALQQKVRAQYPNDTFELRVYPDSYHNFDAPNARLRVRKEVPNGVNPGEGVTTGSNPAARKQAYAEMVEFLRQRVGR
jgi:dienelactone hydrolase